jgi:hypothetical protein
MNQCFGLMFYVYFEKEQSKKGNSMRNTSSDRNSHSTCVHHVGPIELWIPYKEFGLISYCCRDTAFLFYFVPQCLVPHKKHQENWFRIFNLKLYTEIVYCESFKSFGGTYRWYGYGKSMLFTSDIYTQAYSDVLILE